MTIEDAPWFTADGAVAMTRLPRPGRVLVSSQAVPAIPADRCLDVRPGRGATFDGNRVRMPLCVRAGDERRRIDGRELPELEAAVLESLRAGAFETVRFGDRAVCRRVLSWVAVEAIERHLYSAASRSRATLVTWTGTTPRNEDYRTYDAVVEGRAIRFD